MNINPSKSYANFRLIKNSLSNSALSGVYLNIRSLRKNFNNFIASINPIMNKIDLIILVETNITDNETSLYTIKGFHSEFKNRETRRGGGIAIYVKNSLTYEAKYTQTLTFESLAVNLQIEKKTVSVIAIYRPPACSNIQGYITELNSKILSDYRKQPVILIGDINLNLNVSSIERQKYLDFISSKGIMNCNDTLITREDPMKSSSNIDHILIRIKGATINTGVIHTTISDHFSMFFAMDHTDFHRKPMKRENKHLIDTNKVNHYVTSIDWTNIMQKTSAIEIFEGICNNMNLIYKNSVTTKKFKSRRPYPWLSYELINKCAQRDLLYKNWKKSRMIRVSRQALRNLETRSRRKYI